MSKNADDLLADAAERAGWSESRQIDVLLRYIENQGSNDAFADFLDEEVGDVAEEAGRALD